MEILLFSIPIDSIVIVGLFSALLWAWRRNWVIRLEKERVEVLLRDQEGMREEFRSLSKAIQLEAQVQTSQRLHKEAMSHVVDPIQKKIEHLNSCLVDWDRRRLEMDVSLKEQMESLLLSDEKLRQETQRLSQILHNPIERGKWGEMQLRRIVEIAGMVEHCDMDFQVTLSQGSEEGGGRVRPDMVVHLPGDGDEKGGKICVDSKVPLESYVKGLDHPSMNREEQSKVWSSYAKDVRQHITALSKKKYWTFVERGPNFVLLFLPGESLLSAALSADPSLIEYGVQNSVHLATPMTLISLLRMIAHGWRFGALSEDKERLVQGNKDLLEEFGQLLNSWDSLGNQLNRLVSSFNQTQRCFAEGVHPKLGEFCQLINEKPFCLQIGKKIRKVKGE